MICWVLIMQLLIKQSVSHALTCCNSLQGQNNAIPPISLTRITTALHNLCISPCGFLLQFPGCLAPCGADTGALAVPTRVRWRCRHGCAGGATRCGGHLLWGPLTVGATHHGGHSPWGPRAMGAARSPAPAAGHVKMTESVGEI